MAARTASPWVSENAVFFGRVSTPERKRISILADELAEDDTVIVDSPSVFGGLRASPTAPRNRGENASPLRQAMTTTSSSPDMPLRPIPLRTTQENRMSMALIDFAGKLASPVKGLHGGAASEQYSLLDEPWSPVRRTSPQKPVTESLASPPRSALAPEPIARTPSPLELPESVLEPGQLVIAVATPPTAPIFTAPSSPTKTPPPLKAGRAVSPVKAPMGSAASENKVRKQLMGPPKVVLRTVDAAKGARPAQQAAFGSTSAARPVARLPVVTPRGPAALGKPPLASTSKLPKTTMTSRLPSSSKPGHSRIPSASSLSASTSSLPPRAPSPTPSAVASPVKPLPKAVQQPAILPVPATPMLPMTSRSASPGAVQRAAHRIFGARSDAPASATPIMTSAPLQSPRRCPSPAHSPRRVVSNPISAAIAMVHLPTTMPSPRRAPSPPLRRAASPRRIAEAAAAALGHRGDTARPPSPPSLGPNAVQPVPRPASTNRIRRRPVPSTHVAVKPTPVEPEPVEPPAEIEAAGTTLTAAQIQQLTNRHTTRNAAPYNKLDVVVDRRCGPRPPSPSARLRRTAAAGSSVATTRADREERMKKRKAMQETARRASEAVVGDDGEDAAATALPVVRKRPHRLAPGDEGAYESPAKRRAIEGGSVKAVRWDRGLVREDDEVEVVATAALHREVVVPSSTILVKPGKPLDHLGNVLDARQPLSPIHRRDVVRIVKVVYDNDD